MSYTEEPLVDRIETGIKGLDEVVHGGLVPRRAYLVQGGPGTGKTTLGAHFLCTGEPGRNLFISLGETAEQLRDNARRAGITLDDVTVLDLSPEAKEASGEASYNLLESWDVEGDAVHDRIVRHAREHAPQRVFIDSLSQLRYLTPDTFQFRKQVLSLLRQLTGQGATVLFTAETGAEAGDDDLQFLADGVIRLSHTDAGRLCSVKKLRGSGFSEGVHYYTLGQGGMTVYPRLLPADHEQGFVQESIGSGIEGLDRLIGGGVERGTVTVLSGPSGVGKTSIGAHFMQQAARRGERSVVYSFDEGERTFVHRLGQIGVPIESLLERGDLQFRYIEPLRYNPDRFALLVREAVEHDGARVVMLDSLSGYRQSIQGDDMVERVHALCRYLVNMGVTVLLVNENQSIAGGELRATQDGISYLADTIVLLRYLEHDGELCKTVGVLKKRTGDFEKSLRSLEITAGGVCVGEPLRGLQGVLHGVAGAPGKGAADRAGH